MSGWPRFTTGKMESPLMRWTRPSWRYVHQETLCYGDPAGFCHQAWPPELLGGARCAVAPSPEDWLTQCKHSFHNHSPGFCFDTVRFVATSIVPSSNSSIAKLLNVGQFQVHSKLERKVPKKFLLTPVPRQQLVKSLLRRMCFPLCLCFMSHMLTLGGLPGPHN